MVTRRTLVIPCHSGSAAPWAASICLMRCRCTVWTSTRS